MLPLRTELPEKIGELNAMEMRFCPVCGERLRTKRHETEGETLYCARCADYRFPLFSTAISAVVLEESGERMLLIRQYGEEDAVLVAGYVDKGETAEEAVVREIREELGMTARELRFHRSRYYAPSETLMLNYSATVSETAAKPNGEVDAWFWIPAEEAAAQVRPGGLADTLLRDYFEDREREQ